MLSSVPRGRAAVLAFSVLAMGAMACDDSTGPAGGTAIDHVEVIVLPSDAATTNLRRGITVQLLAAPANAANNWVNVPVTWTSSDNTRATVSSTGLVTTIAGGDVTISASAGGKTGTFDLNIQYPVGTVTVSSPPPSIRREGSTTLSATLVGTDGQPAIGRTVTWSSSNTGLATVSNTGVVTGVADGTVTISATSEGVTGTRNVVVSGAPLVATVTLTPGAQFRAVGQTLQLTQTSRAASGTIIPGTTATWSSSATGVATVDANGLVTLVGPGTATITAQVDNGEGTMITGTTTVEAQTPLANGVTITVPNVASEAYIDYAFVSNGTVASFTVVTTGGTSGDSDMHIFAPGVVPAFNASQFTYTNFVCRPWEVGNEETCTINAPVAGTYRIRFYNYPGEGVLTGMQATLTHP